MNIKQLIFMAVLGLLSACASVPAVTPEATVPVVQEAIIEPELPVVVEIPFAKESLYDLMVAELAIQRRQYQLGLSKYFAQAKATKDPAVVARATRLASFIGADKIAIETAKLWVEVEPEEAEAHQIYALLLVKYRRFLEAIAHMETVLELDGEPDFGALAKSVAGLDEASREVILSNVQTLIEKYPEHYSLHLVAAQMRNSLDQKQLALAAVQRYLQLTQQRDASAQHEQAIILKVSLLYGLDRLTEARDFLSPQIQAMPTSVRLRVMYARLLIDMGIDVSSRAAQTLREGDNELAQSLETQAQSYMDEAQIEFAAVLEIAPQDSNVRFSLALVSMENGFLEEALENFQYLLRRNKRVSEVQFYLGRLSEKQDQSTTAVEHYQKVAEGKHFMPAQRRLVAIWTQADLNDVALDYLAKQIQQLPQLNTELVLLKIDLLYALGRYSEGLELIAGPIEQNPEQVELLYARATISERLNMLEMMESDLRKVLLQSPDNAVALNFLGYALADKGSSDRYPEALQLISQALALRPDNAAFIDSLGWVHYRLGNYGEALKHLRQALALLPDQEVAAHLGEVLWVSGSALEAKTVFIQALERSPKSAILREFILRLDVPITLN